MKSTIPFLLFAPIFFSSCNPDQDIDQTIDPCSLQDIEGKEYKGSSGYCNAMPGKQFDFGSIATVTGTEDSLIVIRIFDTIPNFEFDKTFVCLASCREPEPNLYHHDLFMEPGHVNIGQINSYNWILVITIPKTPCENSIFFTGRLK